jgi:hypothetical protein
LKGVRAMRQVALDPEANEATSPGPSSSVGPPVHGDHDLSLEDVDGLVQLEVVVERRGQSAQHTPEPGLVGRVAFFRAQRVDLADDRSLELHRLPLVRLDVGLPGALHPGNRTAARTPAFALG